MSAVPLLEAEDLKPLRGDGSAFDHGVSCRLGPGRIVCVVGPNGGGKTAYLRTLAAIDPPAGGGLRLFGRDAQALGDAARRALRLKVAFISEGAPLLSVVTGLTNVTLPAMYHHLFSADHARVKAEEILAFLGYPGRRDLLPAYLNQHERLLLAIARCLMLSPELMFLDEPFHMTDNACRERESVVYQKLARERGLTLLLATHNLGFVKRRADEIVFVHPEGVWRFAGWKEFAGAGRSQVRDFLDTAA
ncbi:MAG TPA: ATP-binding cassette domain-containing protein [Gammaproteobacteria bacterium]|nr:ATP-binding cassette domain-containing protein [Gammaproteobacteria bacterium]